MSQARIMTIHLDRHMSILASKITGAAADQQTAFWREGIEQAEQIDGWFGPALADRARWAIKRLETGNERLSDAV